LVSVALTAAAAAALQAESVSLACAMLVARHRMGSKNFIDVSIFFDLLFGLFTLDFLISICGFCLGYFINKLALSAVKRVAWMDVLP
jgi:hypothetical protein